MVIALFFTLWKYLAPGFLLMYNWIASAASGVVKHICSESDFLYILILYRLYGSFRYSISFCSISTRASRRIPVDASMRMTALYLISATSIILLISSGV